MDQENVMLYTKFSQAATEAEFEEFQEAAERSGYASFRAFLDKLQHDLKAGEEAELAVIAEKLQKAKKAMPEPGKLSPSWANIWEELTQLASFKREVIQTIPAVEWEGEWQIVLDNPHTKDEVVCYPSLSFLEAAYLFGYFKLDLKRNE
ncbi:MAG: hypothetical protein A2189_05805, partial [Paenibacillus sp. RIFOXYA1_FULL_44_5]